MSTDKDLASRKLPELKAIAEALNIPKARYMRKPELIDAITSAPKPAEKSQEAAPLAAKSEAPAQQQNRPIRKLNKPETSAAANKPESQQQGENAQNEATTPDNKKITVANVVTFLKTIFTDYSLVSEASSATPTSTGTALKNDYVATALTDNAVLAAPSGTANAHATIRYRITASGGTRTIGYNAGLLAGNITRTTSLATGETLTQIYQRVGSTWVCVFESVTE